MQGLCLVDWGRGIDLRLFPDHTVFNGDCRTSGFRCIEMQEKRAWKFQVSLFLNITRMLSFWIPSKFHAACLQVDAYGLCVAVHLMLHNNYMEIVKKESSEGGYVYQPRLPFKRYVPQYLTLRNCYFCFTPICNSLKVKVCTKIPIFLKVSFSY